MYWFAPIVYRPAIKIAGHIFLCRMNGFITIMKRGDLGKIISELNNDLTRFQKRSFGRGPEKSKVYIDDSRVTFTFELKPVATELALSKKPNGLQKLEKMRLDLLACLAENAENIMFRRLGRRLKEIETSIKQNILNNCLMITDVYWLYRKGAEGHLCKNGRNGRLSGS